MKAMIMAAGVGSRLEPLTLNRPKPMVPVVNRPAMEHIVKLLTRYGITEIAANLWYLPEKITDYFQDGARFGVKFHYSREKELMGTAGGVKKLESFLDETFVIVSGDAVTDIDLDALIQTHREKKAIATIALRPVEDPRHFGVVITDQEGKIKAFQEKPQPGEALSKLANTGIYVFEPEIFRYIPAGEVYDFGKQVFPHLVQAGLPFYGSVMNEYWCDIGTLDQYRIGHYDILQGRVRLDIPGDWHQGGIFIGEGTQIAPTAKIGEKVVIGANCRIGDGVEILGETVIGDGCHIGDGVKIFASIIWDQTIIEKNVRLVECVVGSGCRILSAANIGARVVLGDQVTVDAGQTIETSAKVPERS
ncbi:MAG TPA: NDP-sugar synthase [Firmicutes bacterium]|nr:NDP-sugar synthase [Bacillota bacterium]